MITLEISDIFSMKIIIGSVPSRQFRRASRVQFCRLWNQYKYVLMQASGFWITCLQMPARNTSVVHWFSYHRRTEEFHTSEYEFHLFMWIFMVGRKKTKSWGLCHVMSLRPCHLEHHVYHKEQRLKRVSVSTYLIKLRTRLW